MKQYQVYVRRPDSDGWQYGDTFTDPGIAWAGMMLARAKGFATKVIIVAQATTGIDTEVLANG